MKNISTWLLQELLDANDRHKATLRELQPGETVFRVGDVGDYMGVLLTGSIKIRKGDQLISIVEPGAMFGEMGLIDHQPRVADAVAVSYSRIAEIREGQFMSLLESTPYFGLAVMRMLTDRLRKQIDT